MSESAGIAVFADISTLIDFCRIYYEEHRYADVVLRGIKERGGEVHVSSSAERSLNSGLANRHRLLDYLSIQATEYFHEPELSHTDFRADILNYTNLQQQMNFNLSEGYLPDIGALRDELDREGLNSFRQKMDDLRIQAQGQRVTLETQVISDTFSRGGRSTVSLEMSVSSFVESEFQTQSLIDAAYWCSHDRSWILVTDGCEAFRRRDELASNMQDVTGEWPEIHSPKEIVDNSDWFD